jgi:hypothetical protein
MERCDAAAHVTAHSAPWCWSSRTTLDLVPGTQEARWRDRQTAVAAQHAALAAGGHERDLKP